MAASVIQVPNVLPSYSKSIPKGSYANGSVYATLEVPNGTYIAILRPGSVTSGSGANFSIGTGAGSSFVQAHYVPVTSYFNVPSVVVVAVTNGSITVKIVTKNIEVESAGELYAIRIS